LRQNLLTALDSALIHQHVQIVPDGFGEFRLSIHQVHDAQIGREVARVDIESFA